MEKASRFQDQLIGSSGSILRDEIISEDASKNKYYAIVAMCGHVGYGYFVPILFSAYAKDQESANNIIRNFPRVKNQIKNCILATKEISHIEESFIRYINDHDGYLTYSGKKWMLEPRRILLPSFADEMGGSDKQDPRKKSRLEYDVKFAEDYPEHLTLQKYFAPKQVGNKIVYPKNVDMDFLLRDYFLGRTKYLGLKRGCAPALVCCKKIFGDENEFDIQIKDDKVIYVGANGQTKSVLLDSISRSMLKIEGSSRLIDAIKLKTQPRTEIVDHETGAKIKSGMERFAERIQKTKVMKERQGKE